MHFQERRLASSSGPAVAGSRPSDGRQLRRHGGQPRSAEPRAEAAGPRRLAHRCVPGRSAHDADDHSGGRSRFVDEPALAPRCGRADFSPLCRGARQWLLAHRRRHRRAWHGNGPSVGPERDCVAAARAGSELDDSPPQVSRSSANAVPPIANTPTGPKSIGPPVRFVNLIHRIWITPTRAGW